MESAPTFVIIAFHQYFSSSLDNYPTSLTKTFRPAILPIDGAHKYRHILKVSVGEKRFVLEVLRLETIRAVSHREVTITEFINKCNISIRYLTQD